MVDITNFLCFSLLTCSESQMARVCMDIEKKIEIRNGIKS